MTILLSDWQADPAGPLCHPIRTSGSPYPRGANFFRCPEGYPWDGTRRRTLRCPSKGLKSGEKRSSVVPWRRFCLPATFEPSCPQRSSGLRRPRFRSGLTALWAFGTESFGPPVFCSTRTPTGVPSISETIAFLQGRSNNTSRRDLKIVFSSSFRAAPLSTIVLPRRMSSSGDGNVLFPPRRHATPNAWGVFRCNHRNAVPPLKNESISCPPWKR